MSNFTQSTDCDKLYAALTKALGELSNVGKDSENPHFRSKYAALDGILDAIRPTLAAQGLAIMQAPGTTTTSEGATVTTRLIHSSGQWIESTAGAPLQKQDAQGYGSAVTYLRRYAAQAMCGVAPTDDDDDGHNASQPGKPRANAKAPVTWDGLRATAQQHSVPREELNTWCLMRGAGMPKDLTAEDITAGLAWARGGGGVNLTDEATDKAKALIGLKPADQCSIAQFMDTWNQGSKD